MPAQSPAIPSFTDSTHSETSSTLLAICSPLPRLRSCDLLTECFATVFSITLLCRGLKDSTAIFRRRQTFALTIREGTPCALDFPLNRRFAPYKYL